VLLWGNETRSGSAHPRGEALCGRCLLEYRMEKCWSPFFSREKCTIWCGEGQVDQERKDSRMCVRVLVHRLWLYDKHEAMNSRKTTVTCFLFVAVLSCSQLFHGVGRAEMAGLTQLRATTPIYRMQDSEL
jgi:hypothetical protein